MGTENGEINNVNEKLGKANLRTRLNNWVLERLKAWSPKPMEAKARWNIAQAVIIDINNPNYPSEAVVAATRKSISLLTDKKVTPDTPLIIDNKDSLYPHQKYQTRFRRDDDKSLWIAEEVNTEGKTISRASIGDNGESILTITPQGSRFQNANPEIIENQNLPRATVVTFNLLVGTIT